MAHQPKDTPDLSVGDFVTQLDDTYHALRAFNFLLEHTNYCVIGGISGTIAYGVSHLLRRQIDDLEDLKADSMKIVARMERAEAALAKAPKTLPPDMVILPTYHPGMAQKPGGKAGARQVDLAELARDAGTSEETVRKVLARLQADPDTKDNRKAV